MQELKLKLDDIFNNNIYQVVLSKATKTNLEYKKITIKKLKDYFQISSFTQKQVFHSNVSFNEVKNICLENLQNNFLQLNAWENGFEHSLLISKKGKITYKKSSSTKNNVSTIEENGHNRKKNYILKENEIIPPLIDMGVMTKEGKINPSMYDKFKQINRFVEVVDDIISGINQKEINIIDFGCGKSYLTFILYYYFTKIKNINVNIVGLDLKKDVIEKCNETSIKYKYDNLKFELGDINGYDAKFKVDMVITLHACDVATDYALYNAIKWGAKMIFSVPCCQHEINNHIKSEDYSLLTKYGIIKERFSALVTDAIRANILEYHGYKTQVLEFVDLSHTPKNVLIRAVLKNNQSKNKKEELLHETLKLMKEFNINQTLYNLTMKK